MLQGSFAEAEKHDPALDSGVCPSPDECYQSYYDAFPALSPANNSFTFNNNNADLVATLAASACHNWQNTKRSMFDICRTSSPSACLTTTGISREISKSSHSAPSPTLLDHTPNKRQKLLPSKSGNILADIVPHQPTCGVVDNNRSSPFFNSTAHSVGKPRSCPTLPVRRQLSPAAVPNFCCPQVTQSADGDLAACLPIFEANESSQTAAAPWPHFVVPKCFKVGSWPTSKNDLRHPTSDVPFWSCGEWFCTVHKGVQFSLLSAKVDDEASKVLSPDPFYQHMATANKSYRSAATGKIEGGDCCVAVDDELFFDATAGGDVDSLPVVGQFFDTNACEMENWDCAVNVDNICATWDKPVTCNDQIEIPSSYDQLKADVFDTVQLESHWPSDVDLNLQLGAQHDVPEFDPFPPPLYNNFPLVQDLMVGGGHFQSAQEVGFCIPKFDLSPTTLLPKGSNVASATNCAHVKSYGRYANASNNNFKQPTCLPPEIEIIPSSDSFDVGSVNNNGCKQQTVAAVPISPQTHFVPIRSESMEDAYLLQKPTTLEDASSTCTCCAEHGRAKKKGLAYIEDTGYYIFLHPDKSSSRCRGDRFDQPQTLSSSITDCNANRMTAVDACCCCCTCHACKSALRPLMKASKSLGNFDSVVSERGRRCRSPFSVKFRALKPGKMVQTEDKYFLYCSGRDDRYQLHCVEGGAADDDCRESHDGGDPFLCDLDIDDLLAEEAPLDLSSPPHEDQQEDRANNNNNDGDGFFEIWACNALPVPDDPCSQQAKFFR